jgi:hypothetical protein
MPGSRFNATTHVLRALSILLPGEDAERTKKRYVNLHDQLRPSHDLSEILVDRIAFMSIRLERCERFDSAHYSERVNHAKEGHDERRLRELGDLTDRVHRETSAARKIQAMPEGIDWLLDEWRILRDDLTRPEGFLWNTKHLERTRDLRGVNALTFRQSREWILTEMVGQYFGNESMIDTPPGLDEPAKVEWARLELLKIFDAEIARLEGLKGTFNFEALEEERAQSRDRALFDASKELILARKYEAATERSLYKAIREFRAAEATVDAITHVDPSPETKEVCEELGSFGSEADPAPEADEPADDPAPIRANLGPIAPFEAPKSVEIAPEVTASRPSRV